MPRFSINMLRLRTPLRGLASETSSSLSGLSAAFQLHPQRQSRPLISLWKRKKKTANEPEHVATHDDEGGMGVPKAFAEAFETLKPKRQITNGHVAGPPLQMRRSAVKLSERFRSTSYETRSQHAQPPAALRDASEGGASGLQAGDGAVVQAAAAPPPPAVAPVAYDVDETGRAKAVPLDIVMIRKRTALRITWRIPVRASRDGRRVVPHRALAIDEDSNDIAPMTPAGAAQGDDAYEDVLVRTEVRSISAELLRAEAPSTDVKGAGVLVYGKRGITITDLVVVGNYAVRIAFSDGHDAGIFPYGYLYELSADKWRVSREYLERLQDHNKKRQPKKPIAPPSQALACGTKRPPSAAANHTAENVDPSLHGKAATS